MTSNRWIGFAVLGGLLAVIALSSVYIVNERERAVVVRFGEIQRVDESPGLHAKLPLVDSVYPMSTRLLNLNEDAQPFRTVDGKDLVADVYVKWRIDDARQFYLTVGAQESAARGLLRQLAVRRLGEELGKRAFKNIMAGESVSIPEALLAAADKEARKSGIALVDLRVLRLGVPANQTVFDRMRVERTRLASDRKSQGSDAAGKIRDEGERVRDAALAEGYARAERIRGEGDARVAAIYASAAAVAPDFFLFYRSLNAYKESFKKKEDVLVLDPSSDFFKYMKRSTH